MKKSRHKLTKKQLKKACKNLKPGTVYRLHENNEITVHEKGRKYPTRLAWVGATRKMRTFSDKGNMLITKIAICLECGKQREGLKVSSSYCTKCKIKKDERERRFGVQEPKTSAFEIAFKETGGYLKVKTKPDIPDVFEDLWRERRVA